ncbi:ABC transporter permease [Verminephrobacter aporrectodeae subsp. tuberculatae]|uniref:ABC transporter permease n=1 Tax=Verminephrobacter aporrectodeae subsp. tuberculatae TaxID=1110392 RepID=A0ABT3KY37_9BURK|nr:ABC transporter permease [Verminephrobacter aporrectodeae]MCW5323252.1 ABC transporter permease [Verminephrobacter aporrectodeae subsp. tuberculatae]
MAYRNQIARNVVLVLFLGFLLFPLLVLVAVSVNPQVMVFPPRGFSLKWYAEIFKKEEFLSAAYSSFILALATSAVSVVLGVLAALGMRKLKGRISGVVLAMLQSPLFFPAVIVALAAFQVITTLGVEVSFLALLMAHVVVTMPYPLRNVLAQLVNFDSRLEEAAMSLGAKPITVFFRITLPLIRASVVPAFLLVFVLSWNNYTVSIFLAGTNWVTLPLQLRAYLQYEYEPFVAAMSTVLIIFSAFLLFVSERFFGVASRSQAK